LKNSRHRALVLGIVQASAQNRIDKIGQNTEENKTAGLKELSNEYLGCAAYFTISDSKTALDLAISNGGVVCLPDGFAPDISSAS
jgi:hypothetical protein